MTFSLKRLQTLLVLPLKTMPYTNQVLYLGMKYVSQPCKYVNLYQAFVLCCHHTTFHISAAIVSPDYLEGIWHDDMSEDKYLFVKRGQDYDLADPRQRSCAVRDILALMRYLTKFHPQ
jgi:hypothetical protein